MAEAKTKKTAVKKTAATKAPRAKKAAAPKTAEAPAPVKETKRKGFFAKLLGL